MTAQLAFVSIEFLGIDEIDPPFSPQVKEYTIKRTAGTEFQFKVTVDSEPVPSIDYPYFAYPGFAMKYHESSAINVNSWSPNNWYAVTCGPGTSSLAISCEPGPGYRGPEQLVGISATFAVITAHTICSHQAANACTHTNTYTTEGQWWGGGSGSSCVEMLTKCSACGSVVSTSYEHRD